MFALTAHTLDLPFDIFATKFPCWDAGWKSPENGRTGSRPHVTPRPPALSRVKAPGWRGRRAPGECDFNHSMDKPT